jgi:hypothetical protein
MNAICMYVAIKALVCSKYTFCQEDLGENKDLISISCDIEYVGSVADDAETARLTTSCATGRAAVSRDSRPA